MKKFLTGILLLATLHSPVAAEEGMWIPMLIEQLNIKRMQDLGLQLSADDIYSVNHSSLKDAIVQFGGGCTAEIVSPQGLILTNYHCGLGAVQRLSSLEHDYIAKGFWAGSFGEELPCAGLTVTMLVRMEDVTDKVLSGVTDAMTQLQRSALIRQNAEKVETEAAKGTRYEAKVRPFFYGNRYYLMVNEVFRDIRLAGAPPSNIGKFGGDTDNWMWPRHTGDFCVFRIYADTANNPAAYSKENRPYRPKRHLQVSLKGYSKGDFTFVFGYPGTTREYIPAAGVDLTANSENPVRIAIRQKRLDIMNTAMNADRLTRIQYTAKVNGIANFWKKAIGESRGIRQSGAVAQKEEAESRFQSWADSDPARSARYSQLLPAFRSTYNEYLPVDLQALVLAEAGQGIELVRFAAGFRELVKLSTARDLQDKDIEKAVKALKAGSTEFFRNYSAAIDERITAAMMDEIAGRISDAGRPDIFAEIGKEYGRRYDLYAENLFRTSVFADSLKLSRILNGYKAGRVKKLSGDPAYKLMTSIYMRIEKDLQPTVSKLAGRIDSLQRIYMAAQMEMQPDRTFYPDANSTLRVAYGKVDDYIPADAVRYDYFTTLAGVMQKEDTTIYDYRVEDKLKEVYRQKDYGPYADADGTMHVAFIASNHTTGGNSGSPVLNGRGELIGINFDRNWEGTMSDLKYDPTRCRNITLDIRYCLFVIDKVAGCHRLAEEMGVAQR